jgi:hypothetical protein
VCHVGECVCLDMSCLMGECVCLCVAYAMFHG